MGAPRPWPTRWPDPYIVSPPELDPNEPLPPKPDYVIEEDPLEEPYDLPEERLVTWSVTGRCALRCAHCYDAAGHPRQDLSTVQAHAVIARLAAAGVRYVVLSGGEPLLRPDLPDLLRACRAHGIAPMLRSGGTEITPDKARLLAESGVELAGVSLDGASAPVHDAIRGAGMYARALDGVRALVRAGVPVVLEVVLRRRNAPQALDFVALAESSGVQGISFSALVAQGRAVGLAADRLDRRLWAALCRDLSAASRSAPVMVSPACALAGACAACREPNITADGWVTPCYLSSQRLFHVLDMPPDAFWARLAATRPAHRDACGRRAWVGLARSSPHFA